MKRKLSGLIAAAMATLLSTGAIATTFTDNFSPASSQWSNTTGNWTSSGGKYFAQAPSNGPETYSGLPFDFTNTNFSLTVTINALRDEGIWLDTDGSRNNAVLFVAGGNAQQGNWAYWHVFHNGSISAPLNVNTAAFAPDQTYTITVLINGNTYQAFNDPNGVYDSSSILLTTLVDSSFSHGKVGLYDFFPATSFSNFGVCDGDSCASTSATPLPAALPLFATGMALIGMLGWRRKLRRQT